MPMIIAAVNDWLCSEVNCWRRVMCTNYQTYTDYRGMRYWKLNRVLHLSAVYSRGRAYFCVTVTPCSLIVCLTLVRSDWYLLPYGGKWVSGSRGQVFSGSLQRVTHFAPVSASFSGITSWPLWNVAMHIAIRCFYFWRVELSFKVVQGRRGCRVVVTALLVKCERRAAIVKNDTVDDLRRPRSFLSWRGYATMHGLAVRCVSAVMRGPTTHHLDVCRGSGRVRERYLLERWAPWTAEMQ